MKQWKWFGYIAVAALTICAVTILLAGKRTCCFCNSPNYSAPCLVDLETGDILELRLAGPSTSNSTGSAIPAETFSFIRFGNVTGIKQTPDMIELKIPSEEKVKSLALCNKCCNLLPSGYDDRYILADLDSDTLFFFVDGEIRIAGVHQHNRRVVALPRAGSGEVFPQGCALFFGQIFTLPRVFRSSLTIVAFSV